MRIEAPTPSLIPSMRALGKEAFGDDDAFLDVFFSVAYAPSRARCIVDGDTVVAALYWFDVALDGKKLAYLYAIATKKTHRGQGLCRKLMDDVHARLKKQGYAGVILVPSEPSLFGFYAKMEYVSCAPMQALVVKADGEPLALRRVDGEEYARLRALLLPLGGVVHKGESIRFLEALESLYAADGLLLAAHEQDGRLVAAELLGDPACAPRVLSALGLSEGRFRIAGGDTPFAMIRYLSQKDFPLPAYFALAFD